MKRVILTIFVALLSITIGFAKPVPINSFADLMKALNSGKNVRVVIYYAKCQLISDNEIEDKSPDAVGGMSISTYEYFAQKAVRNDKAFVVTSETKLIANPKGKGYVYNYVKIKISEDNKVRIIAQYLDPKTYETLMDESLYTSINDGKNDAGFFIYTDE